MQLNALHAAAVALFIAATPHGVTAAHSPVRPADRAPHTERRTFVITSGDFAYRGLPVHAPAGWLRLRMANTGRELHMLATFAVPRGYTSATLIDSLLHHHAPRDLEEWGGPNAVAPGDTNTTIVNLSPGTYVVGCFVVGADKNTHFTKGMFGTFDVVPAADSGSPPSHDQTVTLRTYGIGMSGAPLHPGVHMLLVRDDAVERHDMVVLKVLPGHTVAEALAWFSHVSVGTPAAVPVAGTTSLHHGEQAFLKATLEPATYVLVCWLTTDNKYHFDLGMKHVFVVPAA